VNAPLERLSLVIAGSRPWVYQAFQTWPGRNVHDVVFIAEPAGLTIERLAASRPDYIFFVHWSWRIPADVYQPYECVGFHMTDLPFGRGGSPLQNLLVRGVSDTKLTAFRVGAELDAGPVFLKRPLSLAGRAQEVYERASALAFEMIDEIVSTRPEPVPQSGDAVCFARRTPAESRIPDTLSSPEALHTFIRMLDADGYPRAFIDHGSTRIEFSNATLDGDVVQATVRLTTIPNRPV